MKQKHVSNKTKLNFCACTCPKTLKTIKTTMKTVLKMRGNEVEKIQFIMLFQFIAETQNTKYWRYVM